MADQLPHSASPKEPPNVSDSTQDTARGDDPSQREKEGQSQHTDTMTGTASAGVHDDAQLRSLPQSLLQRPPLNLDTRQLLLSQPGLPANMDLAAQLARRQVVGPASTAVLGSSLNPSADFSREVRLRQLLTENSLLWTPGQLLSPAAITEYERRRLVMGLQNPSPLIDLASLPHLRTNASLAPDSLSYQRHLLAQTASAQATQATSAVDHERLGRAHLSQQLSNELRYRVLTQPASLLQDQSMVLALLAANNPAIPGQQGSMSPAHGREQQQGLGGQSQDRPATLEGSSRSDATGNEMASSTAGAARAQSRERRSSDASKKNTRRVVSETGRASFSEV